MALVNSTVQRQVIGLKDVCGSNNNDVKLARGVVCKLTVERKENVGRSPVSIYLLQFITAECILEKIKNPNMRPFAVLCTLNMSCCTVQHGTSPPSRLSSSESLKTSICGLIFCTS